MKAHTPNIGPTEKWVLGASADDRVSDVAVLTLQNRLGAILHFLPLAAKKAAEDLEHVHHLRVAARRPMAALRLYEDLMPQRRFEWMKKQLRRVRQAANDARDCDVLLQRLHKGPPGKASEAWQALSGCYACHEASFKPYLRPPKRLRRG